MSIWPAKLVEDIARRKCAIVVGSGMSRQSVDAEGNRPPVWGQFLEQEANKLNESLCKRNIIEAIKRGDFLHACEWLKAELGGEWRDVLRRIFTEPRFQISEPHRLIARLDLRINFSLNFDTIIDRAFYDIQGGSTVKKHYYDADISEFLRGNGRYLIKMHGSLDSPDHLIFTQSEYAEARIKYASFYRAFDSALMTHTFLFLGAGVNDPDMNLLLEKQNFSYSSTSPHYLLASQDHLHDQLKKSLRQNRNLEVIEYKKVDQEHTGLVTELENLLSEVESEREKLSDNSQW